MQRGVTNTLFGTRADDTNELGTVAEELLTNSDARSPSEIPTDIEAPPQRSPSTQSLCSTYAVLNRTSSARQGSQDGFRPSNNDPRAGARFSNSRSMPRSGANSLVHDGAPAHRNASTYSQGPRISKLVRRLRMPDGACILKPALHQSKRIYMIKFTFYFFV